MDRRTFLIGTVAMTGVVSCMPAGPGSVTIVAQAAAGANKGPDGADRPLTLQVVQLKSAGAFDTADFFSLQNPAGLGADFIKAEAIALAPGGKATKTIALDPSTTVVGIVAGFRDPTGKTFRAKSAVSAKDKSTFKVDVGSGGLTMTPA